MTIMANDKPAPTWRNFAAWAAVGAGFYILAVWVATALLNQDAMDAILRPTKVTAELGVAMIFFMAVTGFSNRKRRVSVGTFRNFLIQNAMAIIAFLLVIWGFSALARVSAIGVSEWIAAATGATLIVIACLGTFATASVHAGADLVDDEMAADDMRERGRLILCSLAWIAACGLLLIGLSLAGPGGVLSPVAALAGALVLIAVLTVLGIAAWRLSDELGRTLSSETGNMAFYLIWVLGSGWAMLAHLGFVAAPAPLDWVTMVTVLLFAASFVVLGRRKLLRG
jgi:succinate dehydrogenase hydrophobic anchor subunit